MLFFGAFAFISFWRERVLVHMKTGTVHCLSCRVSTAARLHTHALRYTCTVFYFTWMDVFGRAFTAPRTRDESLEKPLLELRAVNASHESTTLQVIREVNHLVIMALGHLSGFWNWNNLGETWDNLSANWWWCFTLSVFVFTTAITSMFLWALFNLALLVLIIFPITNLTNKLAHTIL